MLPICRQCRALARPARDTADTAVGMLESLLALAMVMQNDLDRFQAAIEPPVPSFVTDDELKDMLARMRRDISPVQESY